MMKEKLITASLSTLFYAIVLWIIDFSFEWYYLLYYFSCFILVKIVIDKSKRKAGQ